MLNSRICEMLDIEYPVFQGGMAWIADGVLAAAVSQGGGLGIIAAGNARGEDVRKEIRIAKEKTHRPIGVNIMLLSPYADEVAKVVLEENVAVVTTGAGNPSKYMESWKEVGIKVIPVVASVALAKRMAKYGGMPDAALENFASGALYKAAREGDTEKVCPNCHKSVSLSRLWAEQLVCPCGYHFRMNARQRIRMITDKDSFKELFTSLRSEDPLAFPGYARKLETAGTAGGETEAVLCGTATIGGEKCGIFVMESDFMMGSMGSVVGEKITLLFEYAAVHRLPVIGYTVSGGARMQEGLLSLMQMAKTSAAVKRHSDAGLFYLAVLTDPTTGGVTASFAMEADILLAEPGATIGFAGPRVVEQTTRKSLPKGFQKAEFVLKHGFLDGIVLRKDQKKLLAELLKIHNGERRT